jgi:hypothetical protein
MKSNNSHSWRAMTPQDIPLAQETIRAGNPQVNEANLEGLSRFPPERLAADTFLASAPDGGIAAAGIGRPASLMANGTRRSEGGRNGKR